MPNWIDTSIAVFFVGAFLLEWKRGFGRAVFDLAALLLGLRITWALNDALSGSVRLASNPHANQAILYVGGFLVAGAALVLLGKLIHSATLVSTGVFDPIFGALCGLGIATIAAHVLVQTIALGTGGSNVPVMIADSVLGTEFLRFGAYHQVLELLYNFNRPEVG
jgi:uncharacterized membrane protein required for colicin V production